MCVIPVGARLVHTKAIREGRTGRDAVKTDARNAIHVCGHDQAMPVNRSRRCEFISNADRDLVAFTKAQLWTGELSVDHGGSARCAREVHRHLADLEIELRASERLSATAWRGTQIVRQHQCA